MSAHDLLGWFAPETDPARRGAQTLLAVAWSLWPDAGVDVLVEAAIAFHGAGADVDRALVESVALEMLLARDGDA